MKKVLKYQQNYVNENLSQFVKKRKYKEMPRGDGFFILQYLQDFDSSKESKVFHKEKVSNEIKNKSKYLENPTIYEYHE